VAMQSSLARNRVITHGPFESAPHITARWEMLLSPGTRISADNTGAFLDLSSAMAAPVTHLVPPLLGRREQRLKPPIVGRFEELACLLE